mmetsp:Transcript_141247/g.245976  ORF Transcript_141247/g.245976 Transcript_141247/m.245976 type:complete len:284 (-) Transcript_141247:2748-3599(-)
MCFRRASTNACMCNVNTSSARSPSSKAAATFVHDSSSACISSRNAVASSANFLDFKAAPRLLTILDSFPSVTWDCVSLDCIFDSSEVRALRSSPVRLLASLRPSVTNLRASAMQFCAAISTFRISSAECTSAFGSSPLSGVAPSKDFTKVSSFSIAFSTDSTLASDSAVWAPFFRSFVSFFNSLSRSNMLSRRADAACKSCSHSDRASSQYSLASAKLTEMKFSASATAASVPAMAASDALSAAARSAACSSSPFTNTSSASLTFCNSASTLSTFSPANLTLS